MTVYDKYGHDVTIRDTQVCTACHAENPLAEYYFSRRNRGSGYSDICRDCVRESYALNGCNKSCYKNDGIQNSKMVDSVTPAQRLAKTLIFEHDENGRTWRQIGDDYPGVSFGILNRIANSNGRWTPKDAALRAALGLNASRAWLAQAVENLEQLIR